MEKIKIYVGYIMYEDDEPCSSVHIGLQDEKGRDVGGIDSEGTFANNYDAIIATLEKYKFGKYDLNRNRIIFQNELPDDVEYEIVFKNEEYFEVLPEKS